MCEKTDPFSSFFQMKKPCANCPFRKDGAIELRPGRVNDIIDGLLQDDTSSFLCHKTLNPEGEDDYGDEDVEGSQRARDILEGEKMCAGAATYLMKAGRPTVGMRFALITGSISKEHWASAEALVIDPEN